jgi:hypothetical protein
MLAAETLKVNAFVLPLLFSFDYYRGLFFESNEGNIHRATRSFQCAAGRSLSSAGRAVLIEPIYGFC